jgi:demethylmenaquinone methyltransferase / 2-methoxy-6-polyprenyl-1,4-benzoquinol methylase
VDENKPSDKGPSNPAKEQSGGTAFFGFSRVPMQEKARHVLRHFNSIAARYDYMNTVLSLGIHYIWKRMSINALGLHPGERVLDVCGGTGDLSLSAARRVGPGGRVILYDINRAMMEGGRKKIEKASLQKSILLVQGDAESLPFPQGSFDAVMVGFGIRNLTNMDMGLAEMHRVLKPGGRMMCLEFSLPVSAWFRFLYHFYSFRIMPLAGKILAGNRGAYLHLPESIRTFPQPEAVASLMRDVGFSMVSWKRLTNGIAVIYTGEKS